MAGSPVDFRQTSAPKTSGVFLQKNAIPFGNPLASRWNPYHTNYLAFSPEYNTADLYGIPHE
jgi:hypothetical protein